MWTEVFSVIFRGRRPESCHNGCDSPREGMELVCVETSGSPNQGSPCRASAAKLKQDHLVGGFLDLTSVGRQRLFYQGDGIGYRKQLMSVHHGPNRPWISRCDLVVTGLGNSVTSQEKAATTKTRSSQGEEDFYVKSCNFVFKSRIW